MSQRDLKLFQLFGISFITLISTQLSLQAPNIAFDFIDDIFQTGKIFLRGIQLALGGAALGFIFIDPGRFFKKEFSLCFVLIQDLFNHFQFDHRISIIAHAGIDEQVLNILQTNRNLVQQVFAATVTVKTASDLHIGVGDSQFARAVMDGQVDFRIIQRFSVLGAGKYHIDHGFGSKQMGLLFTHDPADGIHHIALAAPVRTDDRGNALAELQNGLSCKGFKAHDFQL